VTTGRRKIEALNRCILLILVLTACSMWGGLGDGALVTLATCAASAFGLFVGGNGLEHMANRPMPRVADTLAAAPVIAPEP